MTITADGVNSRPGRRRGVPTKKRNAIPVKKIRKSEAPW